MRHRVSGRKLNRRTNHRKALFKNLIIALINHGRLKTTEAKAKSIKGIVDKLITRAKEGTVHSRRLLGSFLHSRKTVNKLVDEIAPQFKDRSSGFTRIVRLGRRRGDDAMIVNLEFIETEFELTAKAKSKLVEKKTKKRQISKLNPKSIKSKKSFRKTQTTR